MRTNSSVSLNHASIKGDSDLCVCLLYFSRLCTMGQSSAQTQAANRLVSGFHNKKLKKMLWVVQGLSKTTFCKGIAVFQFAGSRFGNFTCNHLILGADLCARSLCIASRKDERKEVGQMRLTPPSPPVIIFPGHVHAFARWFFLHRSRREMARPSWQGSSST